MSPVFQYLVVFAPGLAALLTFLVAFFLAKKPSQAKACGWIGIGMLMIQNVLLRGLIGWGEAWSGDTGGSDYVIICLIVSALAIAAYAVSMLFRFRQFTRRNGL